MCIIRLYLVIFCFSFFYIVGAQGAKPVRIGTFQIPLMVESADRGVFVDLTKEIARRANVPIEIVVYPTAKTLIDFSNNKIDGFFPGLDVYIPKKAAKSQPFYSKVDFVFYRAKEPHYLISDLEGRKVGLTFRYPYDKALTGNKKIKIEFADDDVSNMKKLGSGLIDAFVVEERSGLQALKLSGESNISYNPQKPLSRQTVYYAFQDDEPGRELARKFSAAIEEMKMDGSFDTLLLQKNKGL